MMIIRRSVLGRNECNFINLNYGKIKKKIENILHTVFNSENKIACIETKVEFIINFYFAIINNLILASTTLIKSEEKNQK